MHKMKSHRVNWIAFRKRMLLILVLCIVSTFVASGSLPLTVEAASKTVRVGYYKSDNFQEGCLDQQEKSGYSYEYLQTISNYTGWKYDYVYGDWADLYAMLLRGDIDIMAGVSETTERENYLLFPEDEMGYEKYYIYKSASNTSISSMDLSTLSGKKIGAISDNLMTDYLEDWLNENAPDAEIVYYDDFEDRDDALASGQIDGIVSTDNNVSDSDDLLPVALVGEESYYLAVNDEREDLLEDLNQAQTTLSEMDPYYRERLQVAWFSDSAIGSQLTEKEENWLSTHSYIRVGYLTNYLPYSDSNEEGEATGVLVDLFNAMLTELDLTNRLSVKYIAYDNYTDMVSAVKNGYIDVAFPVGGSSWYLEQDEIDRSTTITSSNMNLVYMGDYTEAKTSRIAINENNMMQYNYVRDLYPDAELVFYDSIEDCLLAVKSGEVDSTVINGPRARAILENSSFSMLSLQQLGQSAELYFGLAEDNISLLLLVNRGLERIGSDYAVTLSYQYTSALYTYTFADFISDNILFVSLTLLLVVGLLILAILMRSHSLAKRAEEEQRKQEELNEALEKAEIASNAKTAFLFNMSHDIRTPMNAIIGFVNLLRKNLDNPDKAEDYLSKIDYSSNYLLDLINNILEMASIENGETSLNEAPQNILEFRNGMFAVFAEQMKERNLTFTIEGTVTHENVFCDLVKVREIFLNIVSNSMKYTNPGGKVTLSMEELPCDRDGYASYSICVEDTGIGMSEDFLPHIFENFAREKTTTESRVIGTGLGMPIVKNLVDLMQGDISVESELGVGTKITVLLTLRIATDEALHEIEENRREENPFIVNPREMRILLAEDNELNAEIAIEILTEEGFSVERAEDGQKCIEMLDAAGDYYYDLILMDVQMPNMNGYEATKRIRTMEDEKKSSIPILALTANAFEEDKKNAYDAGMDGHIAKPIQVEELLSAIARAY